MGSLSDIVVVNISASSVRLQQAGFGVPLVLQYHTHFPELVREYADTDEMEDDGFDGDDPAYVWAQKCFGQENPPESIKVGRLTTGITQRFKITPTAISSHVYALQAGYASAGAIAKSDVVTAASDGSASVAEVITLLKTALDLLTLDFVTSDQTTYLRVLSGTINKWFTFSPKNAQGDSMLGELQIIQDHADPGLGTMLAAIAAVDDDWYTIHLPGFLSKDCATAIATYAEANKKIFLGGSQDGDIVSSSTSDVASTLQDSSYDYAAICFHPDTDGMLDAGMAGDCLPRQPGSENWAHKNLSSIPSYRLTAAQRGYAIDKAANVYTDRAGTSLTELGTVASGEYIDIIRGIDWFQARTQERMVTVLANAAKIPFTDDGAAVFEAELRAQLVEAIDVGLFAASPAPVITKPKVADVSDADKAARHYKTMRFSATLAGAINKITIIGNVSV